MIIIIETVIYKVFILTNIEPRSHQYSDLIEESLEQWELQLM